MRRPSRRTSRPSPFVFTEPLESRRLFATAIASGQTLADSIAAAGERDVYTLTLASGGTVMASAGATDSAMNARVQLFAPSGMLLGTATPRLGATVATLSVPVLFGGTYSVVVSSANGVTGGYNVAAAGVPGVQVEDGDGGNLAAGQVVNGSIDGDLDAFSFSATPGSRIRVSMTSVQSAMRGRLDLFGPDGRRLASATARAGAGSTAALNSIAPAAGTYYLVASSGDGRTGAYTLATNLAPPPGGGGSGGAVVSVAATDAAAAEPVRGTGGNPGVFTVSRTGGIARSLLVRYTLAGTATNGADYNLLNGSVVIPAGRTSAVVRITPKNDLIGEPTETVVLTLAEGTGYTLDPDAARLTGTVEIADNDGPAAPVVPALRLATSDPGASESFDGPTSSGAFTLRRGQAATGTLTVTLGIGGSATLNGDYQLAVFGATATIDEAARTMTLTIPAGNTPVRILVNVMNDDVNEPTERVILALRPGTGYTFHPATSAGAVNIADKDA